MAKVVIGSITLRSGFSSEWNRTAPDGDSIWAGYVLEPGEIGIEKPATVNVLEDPYLMKIGDGNTTWADLPYVGASASEGYQSSSAIRVDNNRNIINLICSMLEGNAAHIEDDGLYVRDRKVRIYAEAEEYAEGDFIVSEDMTEFGYATEAFTSTTWRLDVGNNLIKKITPVFSQEEIRLDKQTVNVYVKQDTGIDLEGTKGTQDDPFGSISYAIYSVRKRMLGKNVSIRLVLLRNDGGDVTYSLTPNPETTYLDSNEYFSFRDVYAIEGEDKYSVILKDFYLGESDIEINNLTVSSSVNPNIPPVATIKSSKVTFKNCIIMVDPNFDASIEQTSLDIYDSYVIFDECELQNTLSGTMNSFVRATGSVLVFHDTTLGGQKTAFGGTIIDNIDTLVVLNSNWKNEYCGVSALYGDMADLEVTNEATVIGTPYQYIRRYQIDQESQWDLNLLSDVVSVRYKTTEFTDTDHVTPVAFKPKISNRARTLDGTQYRKYFYIGPRSDFAEGYSISAISPKGEEYISAGDGDKDGIEWVAKTNNQKSKIYSEPNPDNGEAAHFLDKPSREQFQDNDLHINQFVEESDISALARVSDTFNVFGTPFSRSKANDIPQGYIIKLNQLKKPKIRFKKDDSGQYIDKFAASALKFGGEGENQYIGWHTRVNSSTIDLVFAVFVIRKNQFVDLELIYDSSSTEPWIKSEIKLSRPVTGSIEDARILGGYDDLSNGIRFPLLWANVGYVIPSFGEKIPYITPILITADKVVDHTGKYGEVTQVLPDVSITVNTIGIDPSIQNTARYVLDSSEELAASGERDIPWNMFALNAVYDGLGYEKLPVTGEYTETYQIDIRAAKLVENRVFCKLEDLPDIQYLKILSLDDKIIGEAVVTKKQYGLPVVQISPTQYEGSFDAYDTIDGGDLS